MKRFGEIVIIFLLLLVRVLVNPLVWIAVIMLWWATSCASTARTYSDNPYSFHAIPWKTAVYHEDETIAFSSDEMGVLDGFIYIVEHDPEADTILKKHEDHVFIVTNITSPFLTHTICSPDNSKCEWRGEYYSLKYDGRSNVVYVYRQIIRDGFYYREHTGKEELIATYTTFGTGPIHIDKLKEMLKIDEIWIEELRALKGK